MYGALPFYVANLACTMPLEALPQLLTSGILYWMANLRAGRHRQSCGNRSAVFTDDYAKEGNYRRTPSAWMFACVPAGSHKSPSKSSPTHTGPTGPHTRWGDNPREDAGRTPELRSRRRRNITCA